MTDRRLETEAVLRIGEVSAVTGRKISVAVDAEKNLSSLFFDGDLIRNIAVGSYLDIRKGYLSLIGKVEGENAAPDVHPGTATHRILSVSLVGFLDRRGRFLGGTKELPLVGNEAFLLTREKVQQVHNLLADSGIGLEIATSEYEGYDVALPVDGLINSHIAIFGNTGSGKSNTLAILYQSYIFAMQRRNRKKFESNHRIIFFDFNGEYTGSHCLTTRKKVYHLSTRVDSGDKLPVSEDGLLDIEMLSILADATEKTQKPFLRRALDWCKKVLSGPDPLDHTRNIIRQLVRQIMVMSEKVKADLLIDFMRQVLPAVDSAGQRVELQADLEWHNTSSEYKIRGTSKFLKGSPQYIEETRIFKHVENFSFAKDIISDFITFAYLQLIYDVLANRAQNEHIAPAINKLRAKEKDIRKIFDPSEVGDIFQQNVVVVSLSDVNLDMKKTIPLLLCRRIYQDQKSSHEGKALSIVIDEAHNILSTESFREAESWKDYRLETFEEMIKEGRKFGVFITISSQRPNDISPTITSQAHNYFIHRLINDKDLKSIASAVSYIDRLTEESIPTLPTGTCIFSGVAGQMPLKIAIKPLEAKLRPKSTTLKLAELIPEH